MNESRPVADELFKKVGNEAYLIGSHCKSCGAHYFPKSVSCRNPHCTEKSVEEVLLSRTGTLRSYTIQCYRPPELFKVDDWSPYAIGQVELPEGLRIMGMLAAQADDLKIGMTLEVIAERLYVDSSNRDVLTYKFKPVSGESE